MLLTKTQLNKASIKELQQAADAIKAEITKRDSSTKQDLLKKVKKMAADAGVSIEELLGKAPKGATASKAPRVKKTAGKPRGKVAPKYQNPANPDQAWTGRGRQPLWVAENLAAGKTLDDLRIQN